MNTDTVKFIEGIANQINPTGTFYWGRIEDANLAIKDLPMPQIHLYPFAVQNPNGMGVDVNPNIRLAFIFPSSPHDGKEQLLNTIDEADVMQRRFQLAMQGTGVVVTNFTATPFFKDFSGVNSGMLATFNLQIKSSKVCEQ